MTNVRTILGLALISAVTFVNFGSAEQPKELQLTKNPFASTKVTDEGGFSGPIKPIKATSTVILDYKGELGNDPKFTAVPKPETFRVMKDFDGKPAIIITPGEENAGKTILVVYADNKNDKDGKPKTIVATFALGVEASGPTPPPTPPGPPVPDDATKLKYFPELKAAYLVSPNSDKLSLLTQVYTEIGSTTFSKRSEFASVLGSITKKKLPEYSDLRKVRDTVEDILNKELGNGDNDPWDNAKFVQVWKDINAALAAVKAGK